jgi:hypothetical protein
VFNPLKSVLKSSAPELTWYTLQGTPFEILDRQERERYKSVFSSIFTFFSHGVLVAAPEYLKIEANRETIQVLKNRFFLGVESEEARQQPVDVAIPLFNPRPIHTSPKNPVVSEKPDYVVLQNGWLGQAAVLYRYPASIVAGFPIEYYHLVDQAVLVWESIPMEKSVNIIDRMRTRMNNLASDPSATSQTIQKLQKVEWLAQNIGGQAHLVKFSFFLLYSQPTREELTQLAHKIKIVARSRLCDVDVPRFFQRALFEYKTAPPISLFGGIKLKYTDTNSLRTFYMLIDETLVDEDGVFLGRDFTGGPVVFDPYTKTNHNIVVLGKTGGGKSMFAKVFIRRLKQKEPNVKIWGLDPENEYINVAAKLGLKPVEITPKTRLGLDPFRLMRELPDFEPYDVASLLTQFYCEEKDETRLRSLVFQNRDSKNMEEFVKRVRETGDTEIAKKLEGALYPPDSIVYEGETLGLEPNTVYGLKSLELTGMVQRNRLKSLVMTLLSVHLQRQMFQKQEKGLLFVDEAWLFVDFPVTMGVFESVARRARKYGKSLMLITQRAYDVAATKAGRTVLEQAASSFLFGQEKAAIPLIQEVYHLREEEVNTLLEANPGTCIARIGPRSVRMQVEPTGEELEAFRTSLV